MINIQLLKRDATIFNVYGIEKHLSDVIENMIIHSKKIDLDNNLCGIIAVDVDGDNNNVKFGSGKKTKYYFKSILDGFKCIVLIHDHEENWIKIQNKSIKKILFWLKA